jgi:hypothetical protein
LAELATQPGSRVIKRKGQLFFRGRNGFEILCQRLCEMKARWCALVEHADLPDEDKWAIFNLLIGGDGRLEQVPGGLKVTLPPRQRH